MTKDTYMHMKEYQWGLNKAEQSFAGSLLLQNILLDMYPV